MFDEESLTTQKKFANVVAAWLLPAGYPESCAPQLGPYMFWRGIQYFFGGALSVLNPTRPTCSRTHSRTRSLFSRSVLTTRSLLMSLGVANAHASEASAAINWVIKDGAGRMGRFLFARIGGRSLDDKAKQWRLLGDGLMFMGACGELSTSLAPAFFLPLACSANLAKNLAAVAASATRAPIYRTFALESNLADITAKAESVANLSDVVGTAVGVFLLKRVPMLPAFGVLSVGYLVASRREVDSVELPYFNTARLGLAVRDFLTTGTMPGVREGNAREPLFPWSPKNARTRRIVLGASIAEACGHGVGGAEALERAIAHHVRGSNAYLLTYRPETKCVYVLLRHTRARDARTQAAYEGCFAALTLLHVLCGDGPEWPGKAHGPHTRELRQISKEWKRMNASKNAAANKPSSEFDREALKFVARHGRTLFRAFDHEAQAVGWLTRLNTLNTRDARFVR